MAIAIVSLLNKSKKDTVVTMTTFFLTFSTLFEIVQGLQTFHIGFINDPEDPELQGVFSDKISKVNNKTMEFQLAPVVTNQDTKQVSSLNVQQKICNLLNNNNMTIVVGPFNRKHVADSSNMLSILGIPNVVATTIGNFEGNLWSSYQINIGSKPPKAPFLSILKQFDWNEVTIVYSKDDYGMFEMLGILDAVSKDNSVSVVEEISVPDNDVDNELEWINVGLRLPSEYVLSFGLFLLFRRHLANMMQMSSNCLNFKSNFQ